MNNPTINIAAAALLIVFTAMGSAWSAEEIRFRKSLTLAEHRCLTEILRTGYWRIMPEFHQKMVQAAVVGRPDLKGNGQRQYIFVVTDFASCGTAGCSMLIGEMRRNGSCRAIYEGSGFDHAITVLRKRDRGYRRVYTPCELRFDGREYQQVREECPNINVQR
jgi:hypothetical protein